MLQLNCVLKKHLLAEALVLSSASWGVIPYIRRRLAGLRELGWEKREVTLNLHEHVFETRHCNLTFEGARVEFYIPHTKQSIRNLNRSQTLSLGN